MEKKDIFISLIIGEALALFFLFMAKVLDKHIPYLKLALVFLPILCLVGLYLAYWLAKKIPVIAQFARFILVGALNTAVDFGVLNFLIFVTNISAGVFYSVFKAVSGLFSMTNSFLWNKFWTFGQKNTQKTKEELPKFLFVTLAGFLLNICIASLVVNVVGPQWGIESKLWANIGALSASAIGLTWNFLGYKFIAFRG